jgi:hypothetical protein
MNITFHRALYSKHCKNKAAVVTQILTPSFQNFFQKSKNKSKNSKKKVFSRHLHSFSSFQRLFKKFKKHLKKSKKKKRLLKHFGH